MNPMSNYGWGLPIKGSTFAAKVDGSLAILHFVMVLIFVLWGIYMVYCLVRYRKDRNPVATYGHKTPWSSYLPDGLMFLFEVWLIFVIGVPIWAYIREKLPLKKDAIEVDLIAQQYNWLIHYPGADGIFGKQDSELMDANNPIGLDETDPAAKDDIVSVNNFHVPLGKPVLVNLTSYDVIHSFFVPEFRVKQDAVPGMKIKLWFEPVATGQFEISCAQLCGAGHYRMRGDLFVQTPAEFKAWQEQFQLPQQQLQKSPAAATTNWDYE